MRLRLKVRLLKAEVIETLLYGCITWSPKKPDYDRLRRVHHSMLLRCLGWRKRKRDDHTLSYADALAKEVSENIEAIVRKRRILFAGFVARMGEERLPQRVMFEELVGGKGYAGGQDKDWMVHLKEDMSAFGMKFEGWRKDAHRSLSDLAHRRLTPDFTFYIFFGGGMHCVSYGILIYACKDFVPLLVLFVFFFPGKFFHFRVTGACPVTTDLIMRVNVRTTTRVKI